MSGTRITVIVCAFNEATVLPECLQSLRRQTRAADEILVINNARSRIDLLLSKAGALKDTGVNIHRTREFVVHIADEVIGCIARGETWMQRMAA